LVYLSFGFSFVIVVVDNNLAHKTPEEEEKMSWQDIQQRTFTSWCNEFLKDRGMHVNDLQKDLKDGVLLINLLEIISGKSIGRYNKHPKVPTQKYENTGIAMDFIKNEGIKVVNIGNTDITDGNLRIILGLIWTLILRYQVRNNAVLLLRFDNPNI
jgi:hypothetical protein